jgi:hypothetical protein
MCAGGQPGEARERPADLPPVRRTLPLHTALAPSAQIHPLIPAMPLVRQDYLVHIRISHWRRSERLNRDRNLRSKNERSAGGAFSGG